jgi:hypothetical protein
MPHELWSAAIDTKISFDLKGRAGFFDFRSQYGAYFPPLPRIDIRISLSIVGSAECRSQESACCLGLSDGVTAKGRV